MIIVGDIGNDVSVGPTTGNPTAQGNARSQALHLPKEGPRSLARFCIELLYFVCMTMLAMAIDAEGQ